MSDQVIEQSPESFAGVSDALAELDRREAARASEDADAEAEDPPAAEDPPGEEAEPEADDDAPDEEGESEEDETVEEGSDVLELAGQKVEVPKGTPKSVREWVTKTAADMQADYTQKTTEAAEEVKATRQARQQLAHIAQQQQQSAQALAQMAHALVGKEPDLNLLHEDPRTYLLQKELYQQNVQRLNALLQGAGLSQQQAKALQEQHAAESLKAEESRMLKALPELADPTARQAFTQRAIKAAGKYGFAEAEVMSVTDHRTLRMLKDLVRLEDMEVQRTKVKAKVQAAPQKVVKPAAAPQARQTETHRDAKAAFDRSGRTLKDAMRFVSRTTR